MKLHDVPNGSYIRISTQVDPEPYSRLKVGDQIDLEQQIAQVEWENNSEHSVKIPPSAPIISKGELIYFHHIDGMYSLCQKVNEDTLEHGDVCHMAAWTEVECVKLDELFTFEQIREKIGRSGYGKDGKGEYREAALKDMNDNWVKASIEYVPNDHPHREYYIKELKYREENNISIEDLDN